MFLSFSCFNLDSANEATATGTTTKKKKIGKIINTFFILIYRFLYYCMYLTLCKSVFRGQKSRISKVIEEKTQTQG